MMINQENYTKIKAAAKAKNATLVAVSKTKPLAAIQAFYGLGERVFGENKVQELVEKQNQLPQDINWHFIGHLQTNKVKYIAPFVSLIHAVDSLKLLQEINKQAAKNKRVISCLLQFHIATESSKFGLNQKEAEALLASSLYQELKAIKIVGVMGMASFTADQKQVKQEFKSLKNSFDRLQKKFF